MDDQPLSKEQLELRTAAVDLDVSRAQLDKLRIDTDIAKHDLDVRRRPLKRVEMFVAPVMSFLATIVTVSALVYTNSHAVSAADRRINEEATGRQVAESRNTELKKSLDRVSELLTTASATRPSTAPDSVKLLTFTFQVFGADHSDPNKNTVRDIEFGTKDQVANKSSIEGVRVYQLEEIVKYVRAAGGAPEIPSDAVIVNVRVERTSAHDNRPLTYQLIPSISEDGRSLRIVFRGEARQSFVDGWTMSVYCQGKK